MEKDMSPYHEERKMKFQHLREVEFPIYLDVYLAFYKKISFGKNRIPAVFTQEEVDNEIFNLREKIISETKNPISGVTQRNKLLHFMEVTRDIVYVVEYIYETQAPAIGEVANWIESLPEMSVIASENEKRMQKKINELENL